MTHCRVTRDTPKPSSGAACDAMSRVTQIAKRMRVRVRASRSINFLLDLCVTRDTASYASTGAGCAVSRTRACATQHQFPFFEEKKKNEEPPHCGSFQRRLSHGPKRARKSARDWAATLLGN